MKRCHYTAVKRKTIYFYALVTVLFLGFISESWAIKCTATGNGSTGIDENGNACTSCGTSCNWEIVGDELKITGSGAMTNFGYGERNGNWESDAPWFTYRNQLKSIDVQGVSSVD